MTKFRKRDIERQASIE